MTVVQGLKTFGIDLKVASKFLGQKFLLKMFFSFYSSRSVRIEGRVEKVSEETSIAYFKSRPIGSQIGAAVSDQSQVIPSREFLLEKEAKLKSLFQDTGKEMEKPEAWGGFRVLPNFFEFWQGQSTRIHDRITFRQRTNEDKIDVNLTTVGENDWMIERLSP